MINLIEIYINMLPNPLPTEQEELCIFPFPVASCGTYLYICIYHGLKLYIYIWVGLYILYTK